MKRSLLLIVTTFVLGTIMLFSCSNEEKMTEEQNPQEVAFELLTNELSALNLEMN